MLFELLAGDEFDSTRFALEIFQVHLKDVVDHSAAEPFPPFLDVAAALAADVVVHETQLDESLPHRVVVFRSVSVQRS